MAELSQAAQLHDGPGYIAGQVHQILGYAMISPLHSPHPAPPACAMATLINNLNAKRQYPLYWA